MLSQPVGNTEAAVAPRSCPKLGQRVAPSLFGYHQSLVQSQLWARGFFSADGTFWSWLSAAALQVAQEISAPSRKGLQRQ